MKTFYTYIMASDTGTLYVGMTSNIKERVYQHKHHLIPGFTDKYNIENLLYVETFSNASSAIKREKQLKSWSRKKKINLIDSKNPTWNDLAKNWYK